jgi:N-formylglutamate deformylase
MHTAYTLARPNDGAGDLPIILDSPHSGSEYPVDFRCLLAPAALHDAEDCFVDRLYEHAPRHGASLLAARFPRMYIDPNRSVLDIDELLLEERWPGPIEPTAKTRLGFGLVWRLNKGRPIYDRKLSITEVQRRIDRYWRPYHDALWSLADDAYGRFTSLWHLNVHSMGDDAYRTLGLPVKPLADFVLGDLDGTTADEPTVALIEGVLRDHGFSVARNDPFKGVEIIRRSGRPAEQRHALQIEVKKSCYMDAAAHQPHEGFARVQAALDAMLAALAAHVRARL